MTLWLPPSEANRILDERREHASRLLGGMQLLGQLNDFNKDLKAIDPYLELVKAHETTTHPQLTPGFYHVIRHSPGAPESVVLTLKNEDGSFREPDSGLFQELARLDAWSDRSQRERRRREEEAERIHRHRQAKEQEDRVEHFWQRYKSSVTPSVSMTPGWSNTVKGKRGRG